MPRTTDTLASTLEHIRGGLGEVPLGEPAAFVPLVRALEDVLPAIPARAHGLPDLVKVAAHGLRSLAQGAVPGAGALRDAISCALESAQRCLTMRRSAKRQALVDDAGRAMYAALGWEADGWTGRGTGGPLPRDAAAQPSLSLDDAAILLMQLEPG